MECFGGLILAFEMSANPALLPPGLLRFQNAYWGQQGACLNTI